MVSHAAARRLALSLPEVVEQDHHGFPSFRVNGRIFATLPAPDRLRVMSEQHAIRSAAASHPHACREYYWGTRLACVEVHLARADAALVGELLTEAWDHQNSRARSRTK